MHIPSFLNHYNLVMIVMFVSSLRDRGGGLKRWRAVGHFRTSSDWGNCSGGGGGRGGGKEDQRERQSKSHDQASERFQISDAPLGQGLPPPRRLPLCLSRSSSHVQQSSRPAPRLGAVRARCAHPPTHTHTHTQTHTHTHSLSLTHTRSHASASRSWSLACPPHLLLPL